MANLPQTTATIFSKYGEATEKLAWQLHGLLIKELKGAEEIPDQSIALVGYGYGKGYKDIICTILLSKQGIKLGFYKGTELPDPAKLLTGTGKVHKYVLINNTNDVKNPAVKRLVGEALKAYKARLKL